MLYVCGSEKGFSIFKKEKQHKIEAAFVYVSMYCFWTSLHLDVIPGTAQPLVPAWI